jgi:hypothetical protein
VRLEPHQRQVGGHIPADCRAKDGSAVGEGHAHIARRADDVRVGQEVAIGCDNHAAALRAAGDALARRETSKLRRQRRSAAALHGARRGDLDRHGGRADRPHRVHDGTRVGVEGGGAEAAAAPYERASGLADRGQHLPRRRLGDPKLFLECGGKDIPEGGAETTGTGRRAPPAPFSSRKAGGSDGRHSRKARRRTRSMAAWMVRSASALRLASKSSSALLWSRDQACLPWCAG